MSPLLDDGRRLDSRVDRLLLLLQFLLRLVMLRELCLQMRLLHVLMRGELLLELRLQLLVEPLLVLGH